MLNKAHCAEAQMMIRKPASEVFEAFINPAITTQFWFTKSSGKLEVGKIITWEWEMYNLSTTVLTKEMVPGEKLVYEWSTPRKTVDFTFTTLSDGNTLVRVKEYGYDVIGDDLITVIKDSTGGYTTVLDGAKAYLEHGIHLNLVLDKFPKAEGKH